MKIRPLADRIVVEPIESDEVSEGGIVLPDTAREKPLRGKVVAVGPGKRLEDGKRATPAVSKGDTVLYGKYSGTEVKIGDKEYLILRESDVLGRIVE